MATANRLVKTNVTVHAVLRARVGVSERNRTHKDFSPQAIDSGRGLVRIFSRAHCKPAVP